MNEKDWEKLSDAMNNLLMWDLKLDDKMKPKFQMSKDIYMKLNMNWLKVYFIKIIEGQQKD